MRRRRRDTRTWLVTSLVGQVGDGDSDREAGAVEAGVVDAGEPTSAAVVVPRGNERLHPVGLACFQRGENLVAGDMQVASQLGDRGGPLEDFAEGLDGGGKAGKEVGGT